MKMISVTKMRAIEKQANAQGVSYANMMANAGGNLAKLLQQEFADDGDGLSILGLVGAGNNGGDTLICLRELAEAGWSTAAYLVGERPADDPLVASLREKEVPVILHSEDKNCNELDELVEQADLLLDGLLGTGAKLPLRKEMAGVLAHLHTLPALPTVVAVDCPSGVDCDSGQCASETLPAALTVCMAAVKQGLLNFPAFEKVGRLAVVSIGPLDTIAAWDDLPNQVVTQSQVAGLLPQRPMTAHKGTFGTVLVAAGSVNYTGAALLSAKAAYRIGSGLVRLAVPGLLHSALAGQLPEATWLLLPHATGVIAESAADTLLKNLEKASVLLLGPGLGMEDTTGSFIRRLLSSQNDHPYHAAMGFFTQEPSEAPSQQTATPLPPMVIDADGLKLLARLPDWPRLLPEGSVLTPHPGEMAVLTGLSVQKIQDGRIETATSYANEWNQVVVLKGALTVIAAPQRGARVIPVATAALARAGTGDVLAGIIAGLMAQGLAAFEAALAGAWIHAHAGLEAEALMQGSAPVLASDVLEAIAPVLAGLS